MIRNQQIKDILKENIELVRDENDNLSNKEVLEIAKEWTLEEVERIISSQIDRLYWEQQDSINKTFFG